MENHPLIKIKKFNQNIYIGIQENSKQAKKNTATLK